MTSAAIRYKLFPMKNNSSLIIIGADGFIGSSIYRYLNQAGWKVYAAVFGRPPGDGELKLDVTSAEDFKQLPPGIPLINTAGLPDQSASSSLMRKVHVGGMKNLLAWARETDCPHVIHLSSVSVYGNATVGTCRTESTTLRREWNPLMASLPYGRTKARAEAILEKSGIPWSAPRLPAVYGPGDSFFTKQIKRLMDNSGRPLPPGGKKPVSIMPVNQSGPLMEAILNHGPMNAALNAAGAHVPWKTI
ncbi:MAG: NAD(P)-dependent oxidoreductase, partial [Spirochaetaceae bacterium]|nr:NAD(P)-dependent oxidoreductase [Spirochaetaceae bacterium]